MHTLPVTDGNLCSAMHYNDHQTPSLCDTVPLPGVLSKGLLEVGLSAGRSLAAAITPFRQGALNNILDGGESLRLQFPREDLGFQYTQGAVATTPDVNSSSSSSSPGSSGVMRRGAPYVPSTCAGHRLPHVWLHLLPSHQQVMPDWCEVP